MSKLPLGCLNFGGVQVCDEWCQGLHGDLVAIPSKLYSRTDPESHITEHTLVYEDEICTDSESYITEYTSVNGGRFWRGAGVRLGARACTATWLSNQNSHNHTKVYTDQVKGEEHKTR